jgi:flagellar biosynthesis/type III secretory pathway chaperone
MDDNWEADIAELLTDLSAAQGALLDLLAEKRRLLASGNHASLVPMAAQEQQLIERLGACHQRRQQLLQQAAGQGLPADSIRSLSSSLPPASRERIDAGIRQASERTRFLQHQSLTNWVLVQRSLLHLSQMIEIIATGGRALPTYGYGAERTQSGALVDRAA